MALTREQKENHILAITLLGMNSEYRQRILHNKQSELPAADILTKVDPPIYKAFRKSAEHDPHFVQANKTLANVVYGALLRDAVYFADCAGDYSGPECPAAAVATAQKLLAL